MEITSIQQLKEYAKGQIVELPSFAEDQPFFARIKRPSLIALAKAGKIPNELLTSAGELFSDRKKNSADNQSTIIAEMDNMFEAVCQSAFVEPTYQQIKDAGIELTDDQKSFVFQYAQQGVRALSGFRKEQRNYINNSNVSILPTETESASGNN